MWRSDFLLPDILGDLHKENEGACIDWILTHIWHLLFNHHLVVHLLLLIVLRLHIGLWLILKKVLFRRDARFSNQNSMGYYTLSLYPHFVTWVNPFYYICDLSEQKQPFGCRLTNPPYVTPLRLGSTFIDGFSWTIHQKIADFNSYPLRYQFWKSVYKCWAGTQWRIV